MINEKKKKKKKKKAAKKIKILSNAPLTCLPIFTPGITPFSITSLEKFHQRVVLAYAENIFVIFRYIWPPESKLEWCKCVHVERSEIWVKKYIFWTKNMF